MPLVVECNIARNVYWKWRPTALAPIAESNSDGRFHGVRLKKHVYSPSQGYQRSQVTLHEAVRDVNTNVLRCVKKCCLVYCHLPPNEWRPLQTPPVATWHPWFDNLIP